MQPDDLPKPQPTAPGAGSLNGLIWAVIALCVLAALTSTDLAFAIGLLVLPWVITLGAAFNLGVGLWLVATGRSGRAAPYFLGFVPLALLAWWLWYELSHMGKLFGSG